MKVSNVVISTVVAISAAGALGLAYAQSSYSDPPSGTSATTSQDATAPGTMDQSPSGTASQDSSSTTTQDSTPGTTRSGSTYNERVARADRN